MNKKKEDKIEDNTEDWEARVEELENNWKRALADYKNLEKRVAEEKLSVIKFANSMLLGRFLGIVDNLEMMQSHIDDTGLELIVKEIKQLLDDEGVKEIKAEGEQFDSEKMEAVESGGAGDTVTEVLQKGYLFKGKVLRPARVQVGEV